MSRIFTIANSQRHSPATSPRPGPGSDSCISLCKDSDQITPIEVIKTSLLPLQGCSPHPPATSLPCQYKSHTQLTYTCAPSPSAKSWKPTRICRGRTLDFVITTSPSCRRFSSRQAVVYHLSLRINRSVAHVTDGCTRRHAVHGEGRPRHPQCRDIPPRPGRSVPLGPDSCVQKGASRADLGCHPRWPQEASQATTSSSPKER